VHRGSIYEHIASTLYIYICTLIHTLTHTLTHTHTQTHTHKHTQAHTHTCKHTHMQTHTHTHTNTHQIREKSLHQQCIDFANISSFSVDLHECVQLFNNTHTYTNTHTYIDTHTGEIILCSNEGVMEVYDMRTFRLLQTLQIPKLTLRSISCLTTCPEKGLLIASGLFVCMYLCVNVCVFMRVCLRVYV